MTNIPNYRDGICCANCLNLYDESNITACMKYFQNDNLWTSVSYEMVCDGFEGLVPWRNEHGH
jgi:hypothetical protein